MRSAIILPLAQQSARSPAGSGPQGHRTQAQEGHQAVSTPGKPDHSHLRRRPVTTELFATRVAAPLWLPCRSSQVAVHRAQLGAGRHERRRPTISATAAQVSTAPDLPSGDQCIVCPAPSVGSAAGPADLTANAVRLSSWSGTACGMCAPGGSGLLHWVEALVAGSWAPLGPSTVPEDSGASVHTDFTSWCSWVSTWDLWGIQASSMCAGGAEAAGPYPQLYLRGGSQGGNPLSEAEGTLLGHHSHPHPVRHRCHLHRVVQCLAWVYFSTGRNHAVLHTDTAQARPPAQPLCSLDCTLAPSVPARLVFSWRRSAPQMPTAAINKCLSLCLVFVSGLSSHPCAWHQALRCTENLATGSPDQPDSEPGRVL